jgi:hypothetical protein
VGDAVLGFPLHHDRLDAGAGAIAIPATYTEAVARKR